MRVTPFEAPQRCGTCHEIDRDVFRVSLPPQTNLCTQQPVNRIELYFLQARPKMYAAKTSITRITVNEASDTAIDSYGTTFVPQDTSIENYSAITR